MRTPGVMLDVSALFAADDGLDDHPAKGLVVVARTVSMWDDEVGSLLAGEAWDLGPSAIPASKPCRIFRRDGELLGDGVITTDEAGHLVVRLSARGRSPSAEA